MEKPESGRIGVLSSPWQVRDARPSDLPDIVGIYNSTIASRQVTADLEPVSVDSRRAWFDAHGPGRRPLWVVEPACRETHTPMGGSASDMQTGILGWLSFSDFYGRPAYAPTAELSIYLRTDQRGRGLGKHLLDQALAAAPGLGIRSLLGFIFGHNPRSLALFAAAGFSEWGRLPRVAVLDGVERDLVILGKRVSGDAFEDEDAEKHRS